MTPPWARVARTSTHLADQMSGTPTTPVFETPDRPALDFQRVGRALELRAERWSVAGAYRVVSGEDVYFPRLDPHYNCECGDAVWNNQICKHLICCLLIERDREAVLLARVHLAWRGTPQTFRHHVRHLIADAPVLAARAILGATPAQLARLPRDEVAPLLARAPRPVRRRLERMLAAGHLTHGLEAATRPSLPPASMASEQHDDVAATAASSSPVALVGVLGTRYAS